MPSLVTSNGSNTNDAMEEPSSSHTAETADSTARAANGGIYGWQTIGLHDVPYLVRMHNGRSLKFVSVRIAETQLLRVYLQSLRAVAYSYATVRSHFITDHEAEILNEINLKHSGVYGKDRFAADKDCVVSLEDLREFYAFIEVCYKTIVCNFAPGTRCGFIRVHPASVIPYVLKDDKKYIPLFCFEGDTDLVAHQTVKLEKWHLAYLKFCCKVQGIREHLIEGDSCVVASFDDVKRHMDQNETVTFDYYWPTAMVGRELLICGPTSDYVNPPGSWTRAPESCTLALETADNPAPAAAGGGCSSSGIPMDDDSHQDERPANQPQNSEMLQPMSSNNNSMNIQPPLGESGGIATTQTISNPSLYQNAQNVPPNYQPPTAPPLPVSGIIDLSLPRYRPGPSRSAPLPPADITNFIRRF